MDRDAEIAALLRERDAYVVHAKPHRIAEVDAALAQLGYTIDAAPAARETATPPKTRRARKG